MKMDITSYRQNMSGNIKQWDIWWADVKFEETDEVKRRPVLIVNPQKVFVMALKMTSRNRGDNIEEYRVRDWRSSGLSKPTFIRLRHYLRLQNNEIVSYIGQLSPRDILLIQQRLLG